MIIIIDLVFNLRDGLSLSSWIKILESLEVLELV